MDWIEDALVLAGAVGISSLYGDKIAKAVRSVSTTASKKVGSSAQSVQEKMEQSHPDLKKDKKPTTYRGPSSGAKADA
jgi:hypothetical protein